jgi:hypothetical protein
MKSWIFLSGGANTFAAIVTCCVEMKFEIIKLFCFQAKERERERDVTNKHLNQNVIRQKMTLLMCAFATHQNHCDGS